MWGSVNFSDLKWVYSSFFSDVRNNLMKEKIGENK